MYDKTKESWRELCEQAAKEEDPERLMQLVVEIDRLLQEKELRPFESERQPDKSMA